MCTPVWLVSMQCIPSVYSCVVGANAVYSECVLLCGWCQCSVFRVCTPVWLVPMQCIPSVYSCVVGVLFCFSPVWLVFCFVFLPVIGGTFSRGLTE